MRAHASLTVDRIIEAIEADEYSGFCWSCGAECYGIEPDASGCECEECGEPKVMGAEDCLLLIA